MKYDVVIEEVIQKTFTVECDDTESPIEIARQKYHNGEFVLDGDAKVTEVVAEATNLETKESTSWVYIR